MYNQLEKYIIGISKDTIQFTLCSLIKIFDCERALILSDSDVSLFLGL